MFFASNFDRERERERDRKRETERERQKERDRKRDRNRDRKGQKERERDRKKERQKERQRDRQKETEKETKTDRKRVRKRDKVLLFFPLLLGKLPFSKNWKIFFLTRKEGKYFESELRLRIVKFTISLSKIIFPLFNGNHEETQSLSVC
jgi:hypothetical protein